MPPGAATGVCDSDRARPYGSLVQLFEAAAAARHGGIGFGAMKTILMALCVAGCASADSERLTKIEERIDALERHDGRPGVEPRAEAVQAITADLAGTLYDSNVITETRTVPANWWCNGLTCGRTKDDCVAQLEDVRKISKGANVPDCRASRVAFCREGNDITVCFSTIKACMKGAENAGVPISHVHACEGFE